MLKTPFIYIIVSIVRSLWPKRQVPIPSPSLFASADERTCLEEASMISKKSHTWQTIKKGSNSRKIHRIYLSSQILSKISIVILMENNHEITHMN